MTPSPDRKKMLITGVSGLLGNNLACYFARKFDILGLHNEHPVVIPGIRTECCDLLDFDAVRRVVDGVRPSVIIHCASLANVDACESDPELSERLNVDCTRRIVDALGGSDTHLLYISTDSVYEGTKGRYSEEDAARPLNVYGRTKWEGEKPVLERPGGLVLRTNLFGWNIQDKKSLGEWILGELAAGRSIGGFRDAVFSTIYTMELARVIDVAIHWKLSGLYNCGSSDSCSKYEFALKIADRFGFDRRLIRPISIDDFEFRARRGKDLSLSTKRIEEALEYRLPDIDQSVDTFYKDYRCGVPERIKAGEIRRVDPFPSIPYGRQTIDEEDIDAVRDVLLSTNLTQGPRIVQFEAALSITVGASYAVACNSGTSALHMACLAAGVGRGDEVITSPNTFVASANCAIYCGAKPVFADIDSETYNITAEEIDRKITKNTKAVIPVHFAGQSCDMESIRDVVRHAERKYGRKIYLIEDACHALGSTYRNSSIGSCTYSDMTVMSFHPVKHITTAEGGAVLTHDSQLLRNIQLLRSHGITSDPGEFQNQDLAFQPSGTRERNPWYYEQIAIGFNYRITDMQCALGLSQLGKLDRFKKRRRKIVDQYNRAFQGTPFVKTPFEAENGCSNFHLYVLLIDFNQLGMDRARFMIRLRERGILTQVHYIPVHLQSYYRKRYGTNWGDCPQCEAYYERCLSIPLYPAMTEHDVSKVIAEVSNIFTGAGADASPADPDQE
jgi:perosamine synthetase